MRQAMMPTLANALPGSPERGGGMGILRRPGACVRRASPCTMRSGLDEHKPDRCGTPVGASRCPVPCGEREDSNYSQVELWSESVSAARSRPPPTKPSPPNRSPASSTTGPRPSRSRSRASDRVNEMRCGAHLAPFCRQRPAGLGLRDRNPSQQKSRPPGPGRVCKQRVRATPMGRPPTMPQS
nr:hypothetical protein CFP56_20902 [Quercus suber]